LHWQCSLLSAKTEKRKMASASFLKSSPVLDKSEFVKGQTLRLPSASIVRCRSTAPSALTVRAGSYAEELVKTAVCYIVTSFNHFSWS
jgi:hypothetical protein